METPTVTFDRETVLIGVGEKYSLTATASTNDPISYSSSSEHVQVDSSTGEITAISIGEALITASIQDGKYSDVALVTVEAQ